MVVRRSTGGAANVKDVSVNVEEYMGKLILLARYLYIVQRPIDFALATLDNLDDIESWFKQLEKNQPTKEPAVFTDAVNKKSWFESLVAYLCKKTGESGMPLDYVVTETVGLPLVDQGFATPSFEEEVSSRARHAGHYWRGDNKMVWLLMEEITQGTSAWSITKAFSRSNNGRGAYRALHGAYMGDDVKRLLLKKAEATLALATFDGKSKTWTFLKHAGRLRESFEDIETAGQVLTGEMKVNKLMASFQFEALKHLPSIIELDPNYSSNFEAAVAFIQGQINSLRLKNGSNNRSLSAIESMDVFYEEDGSESDEELTELQLIRRDLKQLKLKMTDSKTKKPPTKKNVASKYDKKNPGAYIPWHKWKELNTEQQNAARESRKQDDIPSRQVSLLSTQGGNSEGTVDGNSEGTDMNDADVDSSKDASKPLKSCWKSVKLMNTDLLVSTQQKELMTTKRLSIKHI